MPSRFEEKTMRLPSGDQTGLLSSAGSKVNREDVLRARSINQMSAEPPRRSRRLTATRFSSGESREELSAAGIPPGARSLPPRSNQASWAFAKGVLKKASMPASETEKNALQLPAL